MSVLVSVAMQGLMAIVPLALLPYLGRTLGVEGLGFLTVGQAFSLIIANLIDFGFHVSATRSVAVHRSDSTETNRILADVQSAKVLVAGLVVLGAILVRPALPILNSQFALFAASLAFGVFQGMSYYWFFGGLQRQTLGSALELGAKLSAAICVFTIVRTADDAWKVQASFALAQFVWVAIAARCAYQEAAFVAFSFSGAWRMIQSGRHIFAQHIVGIFYNASSVLLLGFVATAEVVGVFAAAEKLARAPLMPIAPFRQIFFPMMVQRFSVGTIDAFRFWKRLWLIVLPVAGISSVLLFVFAERLLLIVFGSAFPSSVLVLRVLSGLPVVAASVEVVATYWLLPSNKDALVARVVIAITVVHTLITLWLGAAMGAVGAGVTVIISQTLSLLVVSIVMWRMRGEQRIV